MTIKKIRVLDEKHKAMSVHLLTASGAVFAMFALLAAAQENWNTMFLWLIVAFIVDGIDGPLARKFDVITHAPRYDGSLLDLIVDYMTYAFIPAFALYWSEILPGWLGLCTIGIITFTSAIYFVDTNMKNKEHYFVGFPGCWNMFVLVVFVTNLDKIFIITGVIILSTSMFLPLLFIHPTKTKRWRVLSLPIAILWVLSAILSSSQTTFTPYYDPSSSPFLWKTILLITSVYLLCVGMIQQLLSLRKKHLKQDKQ